MLTTLLPEDDIPVVPEDRSEAAMVAKTLKKIYPRIDINSSLSHQERIDQIRPLVEVIIRDVDDIANLDRIPSSIIQKARCSVWLALVYDLF